MIDFVISANGKDDDEGKDEVLLIDLDAGAELIVSHSGGLGVSEVSTEETIEGDDGLQYEKGHWVSAKLYRDGTSMKLLCISFL